MVRAQGQLSGVSKSYPQLQSGVNIIYSQVKAMSDTIERDLIQWREPSSAIYQSAQVFRESFVDPLREASHATDQTVLALQQSLTATNKVITTLQENLMKRDAYVDGRLDKVAEAVQQMAQQTRADMAVVDARFVKLDGRVDLAGSSGAFLGGTTAGTFKSRNLMDHKAFSKVPTFSGGNRETFLHFRASVERLVGLVYGKEYRQILEMIRQRAKPITNDEEETLLADVARGTELREDLENTLGYVVTDEPERVLCNISESDEMSIFEVWRRYETRYNPRSVQHDVSDMRLLHHPP